MKSHHSHSLTDFSRQWVGDRAAAFLSLRPTLEEDAAVQMNHDSLLFTPGVSIQLVFTERPAPCSLPGGQSDAVQLSYGTLMD